MQILGIDVGGTFTDLVVINQEGDIKTFKSSTTPHNPSDAIMDVLTLAAKWFEKPLNIFLKDSVFLHGCTIGTNAVIQGKYGRTGLICTKGFGDTIIIRRALKGSGVAGDFVAGESLYDAQMDCPRPLVPRSLIEEVTERVNYEGDILIPLDSEECRNAIRKLVSQNVEGIAVSLLWSPINPTHEKKIMELIKEEFPNIYLNSTCSSDLIPQIREYERTSSVALNVCLKPIMRPYLTDLENRLHKSGLPENVPVLIMQLHGGVTDSKIAAELPCLTLGSGPVGGVVGSLFLGSNMNLADIVTMDMGGTSFDVGVIVNGNLLKTPIAMIDKYHLMIPMIDVRSIGAGGGSIAYLEGGNLKVGPQSAQAIPGPACYGKGGTQATVTDANVILGYIRGSLASGQVTLDEKASYKAIKENIADKLSMTVEEAAAGIFDLVNANMSNEIRLATTEKGFDLNNFVALIYGGAGPVHSSALCKEMNIQKAIVPWFASTFSAFGIATSDFKHTYIRVVGPELLFDLNLAKVNEKIGEMKNEGLATLKREGVKNEQMYFTAYFDMRFEGQLNEITVPLPSLEITKENLGKIQNIFLDIYSKTYAFVPDYPTEVVTARLEANGRVFETPIKSYKLGKANSAHAISEKRKVFFREINSYIETPVYSGAKIIPGNAINGNALIEYPDTTIVVRPGQKAMCDKMGNIIIDIRGTEKW